MARRSSKTPQYLIQEPTTGLYAVFGDPDYTPATRLDYRVNATHFASASDAVIAARAAGLGDQPHELVRVDA